MGYGNGAGLAVKIATLCTVGTIAVGGSVDAVIEYNECKAMAAQTELQVDRIDTGYATAHQEILMDYATIVETYDRMGVAEDEIVERLSDAKDWEKEAYRMLEESLAQYEAMKKAYQFCLSEEQYAVFGEAWFDTLDVAMAGQVIAVEDLISFMEHYGEHQEVREMFEQQMELINVTGEMTKAGVSLLKREESRTIMKNFTVEDIQELVEQGYNLPNIIMLYVMSVEDGNAAALEGNIMALSNSTEAYMSMLEEYANFVAGSESLQALTIQHQENQSAEVQEYYQKLLAFYESLLQ